MEVLFLYFFILFRVYVSPKEYKSLKYLLVVATVPTLTLSYSVNR